MPKIHLLDKSVAELIAAGEVIDRPASIVKELVENSIDAGASRVTVEIKNGGITYLRVTDDGCGIAREDIPSAFVRHATSKVLTAEDLDAITTLGFRGEALPSVAAVSRVELISRVETELTGTRYMLEGGEERALEDTGCAQGTTLVVRDLFYNTPARMKFLKKDVSEANAVETLVDRLALANPGISFRLIREGQTKLMTPGNGDLLAVIRLVCGQEIAAAMIPVDLETGGICVQGFASQPGVSRSTRTMQHFFLNTRFIQSRTCQAAVEEAYKNRLMGGKFPACVLNLMIPAGNVDVNVHPAKLEVRFSNERAVYSAVYAAVQSALRAREQGMEPPSPSKRITPFDLNDFDHTGRQKSFAELHPGTLRPPHWEEETLLRDDTAVRTRQGISYKAPAPEKPSAAPKTEEAAARFPSYDRRLVDIEVEEAPRQPVRAGAAAPKEKASFREVLAMPIPAVPGHQTGPSTKAADGETGLPRADGASGQGGDLPEPVPEPIPYRVLGEAFETYIIAEQGDELVLIDKHAAHERYIYNHIKDAAIAGERQTLLATATVTLSREEYHVLLENLEALDSMGFGVEDFGGGSLIVREVPLILTGYDLGELLGQIAEKLLKLRMAPTPDLLDELMYSVSCRAAVMAGKRSSMPELLKLAGMVLGRDGVHHCPHGRPTSVRMTRRELEKMFGRLG